MPQWLNCGIQHTHLIKNIAGSSFIWDCLAPEDTISALSVLELAESFLKVQKVESTEHRGLESTFISGQMNWQQFYASCADPEWMDLNLIPKRMYQIVS